MRGRIATLLFLSFAAVRAEFSFDLGDPEINNAVASIYNDLKIDKSIQIGGLGSIDLICEKPPIDFQSKDEDLCRLPQEKNPLDFLNRTFNIGKNGCSISLSINAQPCEKSKEQLVCEKKNRSDKESAEILGKIKSGIAQTVSNAKKYLGVFGGKAVFGKDLCAGDEGRYGGYKKTPVDKVYGKDGILTSILGNGSADLDPSPLNKRESMTYGQCVEEAIRLHKNVALCSLVDTTERVHTHSEERAAMNQSVYVASTPIKGSIMKRAKHYWAAYKYYAKKYGVKDARVTLAIGIQESRLIPTAKNPNIDKKTGRIKSWDFGIMQINSIHKRETERLLGGTYPNNVFVASGGIEFGTKVYRDCAKIFGERTFFAINCYNKGKGGVTTRDGYVKKVIGYYKSLDPKVFSNEEELPYSQLIEESINGALTNVTIDRAVAPRLTPVHIGKDALKYIPLHKQKAYKAMVAKHMIREAVYKKSLGVAVRLEKELQRLERLAGEAEIAR